MHRGGRAPATRVRTPFACLCVLGWTMSFSPSNAHAQALGAARVSWDAPRSCPASSHVLKEAERLLGPDFQLTGELEVDIEIEQAKEGFVLQLEIEGEDLEGERTLRMQSCEDVRDAAALLIAVSLDPELASRAEPEQPAATQDDQDDQDEPSEPGASPQALALELALPALGIDSALLPNPSVLLGTEVALRFAMLRFAIGFAFLWPNEATGMSPEGRFTLDVGAAAMRATVCAVLLSGERLEAGPCAGLWLGRMWAQADDGGDDGGELLLAPELGAAVNYRLSSLLSLALRVGALLPLGAPRFEVRGGSEIHQADGLSVQGALSLVFRFELGG